MAASEGEAAETRLEARSECSTSDPFHDFLLGKGLTDLFSDRKQLQNSLDIAFAPSLSLLEPKNNFII